MCILCVFWVAEELEAERMQIQIFWVRKVFLSISSPRHSEVSDTVAQYNTGWNKRCSFSSLRPYLLKVILAYDLGNTFMNKSMDWNWTLAQETDAVLD